MIANEEDVRYAYRLLLGREPDDDGFKNHVDAMNSGGLTTLDVAQAIMGSREYLGRFSSEAGFNEIEVHGVTIFPWSGDHLIGDPFAATGEYEQNVLPLFLESLRTGFSVLDVGANVGIFSLTAARKVGAGGVVYAVEPLMKNIQSICAGIIKNGFNNIRLMPVAASDRSGAVAMERASNSSNGIVDLRSSVSSGIDLAPTQRLDELLAGVNRIDVVKIDVEGFEPVVWEGMKSLVARCRPLIFTEFSPIAIRNTLRRDAEDYLDQLFEFASGQIDVLHRDEAIVSCTNATMVMNEWRNANDRVGLDGRLHLDLMVNARR